MSGSDIKNAEAAADRALRLMRGGADMDYAVQDAAHFFSASKNLVRAAVKAKLQAAQPGTPDTKDRL